jgi:hypothetical protein
MSARNSASILNLKAVKVLGLTCRRVYKLPQTK